MTDEEAKAAWARLSPADQLVMLHNIPREIMRSVARDLQRSTLSKCELLRIHITSLKEKDIDEMAKELTPKAFEAVGTLLTFFLEKALKTS